MGFLHRGGAEVDQRVLFDVTMNTHNTSSFSFFPSLSGSVSVGRPSGGADHRHPDVTTYIMIPLPSIFSPRRMLR